MVEGISDPRVMALPVEMRNRALFDNSLRVQGIGNILVLDPAGNVVIDSEYPLPRKANFADRDYFKVFEGGAHTGLYVGAPVRARLSGLNSLPVSRAFYDSDGRLAGVVVGTIRLAHFQGLFEELNLGAGGALNLFRADGVLVTRFFPSARTCWSAAWRARPPCAICRRPAAAPSRAVRRSTR